MFLVDLLSQLIFLFFLFNGTYSFRQLMSNRYKMWYFKSKYPRSQSMLGYEIK